MFFFQVHMVVADRYTILFGIISSGTGKTYFSLHSFVRILEFLYLPVPEHLLHPHIPMMDDSGLYQIEDVCGPDCSILGEQWVMEKEAARKLLDLQRASLPEGPLRDIASSFYNAIFCHRLTLLEKDRQGVFHFKPCGLFTRGQTWTAWFDEIRSCHRPARRPLDPRLLHLLFPPLQSAFTSATSRNNPSTLSPRPLPPSSPAAPPPPPPPSPSHPPPPSSSPPPPGEASETYDPFHVCMMEQEDETTTRLSQELSLNQALDAAMEDYERARLACVRADVQAALAKARLEYETTRVQTLRKVLNETSSIEKVSDKQLNVKDVQTAWKRALQKCLNEMRDDAYKQFSQQWTSEKRRENVVEDGKK